MTGKNGPVGCWVVGSVGLWLVGWALGQLLFALEQLVELDLVEVLEVLGEGAAVGHPLPDGLLQGAGDVEQGAFALVACGQIQGAVRPAFLAAAGGLAAGA